MPTKPPATRIKEKAPTDIRTVIQRIIPSAILAPSAHNTQPWQFSASSNHIDIFVDWDRHLDISDPTNRQLYVSIGCALTNAITAARYWNYHSEVTYFPSGTGKSEPAARLTLKISKPAQENDPSLFTAISQRHTDRSLYDAKPFTNAEREQLPTRSNQNIIFIEDRKTIDAIADLSGQATEATLSRHDFKEELSHWVRNNWTKQDDGMPGYAMGIPAPVSLIAPIMVRFAPIHKQEGPKNKQQVSSASAIAVIATSTDTPVDWIKSGQLLEQIGLEATAAGLAGMTQVAAVEASEPTRAKLKQVINAEFLPQSIIRLGHSSESLLRATPRRSVADCLRT